MIGQELEIALRFPAWATGWVNLGTLKEFGVGVKHNFNLRMKKQTNTSSAESSMICLESNMGKNYNNNFLFLCDGVCEYILQKLLVWKVLSTLIRQCNKTQSFPPSSRRPERRKNPFHVSRVSRSPQKETL